MSDEPKPPEEGGEAESFELISVYTRAQALEDGTLIDVTERAKEAGITIPTALTRAVWSHYVELTPAAERAGNDVEGRLWDILWMFRWAAVQHPDTSELVFELYVVTDRVEPSLVRLKAVCGAGDDGEPVITLLLPDED